MGQRDQQEKQAENMSSPWGHKKNGFRVMQGKLKKKKVKSRIFAKLFQWSKCYCLLIAITQSNSNSLAFHLDSQ